MTARTGHVSCVLAAALLAAAGSAVFGAPATDAERADARGWIAERVRGAGGDAPFSFTYGGRASGELLGGWPREAASRPLDARRTSHTVTWTDPDTGLRVRLEAIEYGDVPAVEWVVRIANTGAADTPVLDGILALDALLPGAGEPGEVFTLHRSLGDSNSADSFRPVTDQIGPGGALSFAPRGGRSSDGHMPFFNLQGRGGGAAIAIGWSGQWAAGFRYEVEGAVRARAGMERTHLKLHPGEAIRTPRILLAFWRGADALRGNHHVRATLVNHYTPRRGGEIVFAPICGTVAEVDPDGSYEGPHIRVMRPLAELGIEVFWSDMDPQQWYPGGFPAGTGTWEPDPAKYPRGLEPVGAAAREAGLGYLLWFEPERVARGTQIAREHPEWVSGGAEGGLFRLDDPAARRWITDKIDTQITLAGLAWVRWDFNMEPLEHWRRNDAPERQGMTEIRHIEGLYAMWDELRARHPGLLIDICASGGRRLDIETLSRGLPLWHSDLQCEGAHPEADQLQNAGLYRWLPLHACGVFGLEPSYAFRSAATTGNVFCLAAHAPENAASVRRSIALQRRLRPYALGDFYDTLPHRAEADRWFAYQFHRADLDAGCLFAYRRGECAERETTLPLRGLRAEGRYEVTFEDTGERRVMAGAALAALRVAVPEAPGAAIVLYEPADGLVATGLRCEYAVDPLGIDHARPRLSWVLAATEGGALAPRGARQSAYRVLAASSPERLDAEEGDLWDSGKVLSAETLGIEYAGRPLASRERCYWKVRLWDGAGDASAWSAPARWTMGLLAPGDWHARWIAAGEEGAAQPLPILRTAFRAEGPVRRAELAICGLGFHEPRLNGAVLDDAVLEPGWTDYRSRCLYRVHDVTGRVVPGENVLGVMLGNGMYNVTGGRYTKFTGSFGPPKLIAQLDIEYADGTAARVVSDGTWRAAPGPVLFSCIYGGEDYDARREQPGWDQPGFDASGWAPARECDGPGGLLTTRSAPPIKVRETFRPACVTQPRPGLWVYDLGQNFSGWPWLRVVGPAGATLKMVTGELLDADGLVSQRSSGGPVWFAYTLRGEGTEAWRPRFSYTGFRYVQIEGGVPAGDAAAAPEAARVEAIEGQFIYPETAADGAFSCSNPDVNRVHALIRAAIKSNFKSVLTDCPHREKLGWLECAHLLAGCFMYNYNCARFYAKIADDMSEAQLENGLVPDIAPEYVVFSGGFRDSPEWGSACVIAPWRAYWMYGDRRILEEHYGTMQRYAAYLGSRAQNGIVSHGLGDWYDIGPGGPGESQLTSRGVTATGVYYQDLEILRQVAELLGREEDARAYAARAGEVRRAFNAAFFHAAEGRYDRNSQTGNAMPLALGLVEPGHRGAVLESLVADVRARGNRVTAGDVGFYYVVQALLNEGQSDLLYDMLCQTDGPGYMFQLRNGATSLTEAWDTNPASSQNHCMLGHIEEWLYTGVLGIRAAAPGFRKIVIRPQLVGDLTWARGHYDAVAGRIASAWERDGDRVLLEVTIPGNTTARVYVPAVDETALTESGQRAASVPGVEFLGMEGGAAVYAVGSGRYRFAASLR